MVSRINLPEKSSGGRKNLPVFLLRKKSPNKAQNVPGGGKNSVFYGKQETSSILQYFKELSGHGRRPLVPECHVKNKSYQRGAAMRLRKVSREVRPRTPVSRSFQSTTVRGKKENLYTSVRQES